MQINFTTAQQNCRGKGGGGKGDGGKGGSGGPMGGGMGAGSLGQGGKGGMGGGKGKGGVGRGRSIYLGNLPREITPGLLASVSLGFGLLESMRFMPQQAAAPSLLAALRTPTAH